MFSIFDIFKVSIGPSSSHTMGPMIAAKHFRDLLINKDYDKDIDGIRITLFGSLAFTGLAHGSNKGIILGLQGYTPETIDSDKIESSISHVFKKNKIKIFNSGEIYFNPLKDIIIDKNTKLKTHSNTMEISASINNKVVISRTYYSIGHRQIIDIDLSKNISRLVGVYLINHNSIN